MDSHIDFRDLRDSALKAIDFDAIGAPKIDDNNYAKRIDNRMKIESEKKYLSIVDSIVNASVDQLDRQNSSKENLKRRLFYFFTHLLASQYIVLVAIIALLGFRIINISDTVIISYITSVFAETIGAIVLMVKYAFNSDQDVQILSILNGVVEHFQKFS